MRIQLWSAYRFRACAVMWWRIKISGCWKPNAFRDRYRHRAWRRTEWTRPLHRHLAYKHIRPCQTIQAVDLKAFFQVWFSFHLVLHCTENAAWMKRVYLHLVPTMIEN